MKNNNEVKNAIYSGINNSVKETLLPKGGGAIKGIGETFQPDAFSGTGNYSIPLQVTSARGFEPDLSLNYNSGSGNGIFGLGFSLGISKISIRTDKGIPRYDDSDIYIISQVGELVKKKNDDHFTNPRNCSLDGSDFIVTTYLPRIENVFARIEKWQNSETKNSFWKIISKDNTTSFYGKEASSRIGNPENENQIFEWLIDESMDSKGNKILYNYICEDSCNVPVKIYEEARSDQTNRYIHSIKYGNYIDKGKNEVFAFEIVFDYGEYNLQDFQNIHSPSGAWLCRPDSFSSYRSGFEVRTHRLCRNILLFHYFNADFSEPLLVKSFAFDYKNFQNYGKQSNGLSFLSSVKVTGYRKNDSSSFSEKSLPIIELKYSAFNPPQFPEFKKLQVNSENISGYLNNSQFLPIDLNGEGIAGLLYSNDVTTFYLNPEGDGCYGRACYCNSFPVHKNLQGGEAYFADIDGNGELELVVKNNLNSGYYPSDKNNSWDNFRPFENYPNDISNRNIEMVDMNANGKVDLLLADDQELTVYYSDGKNGFNPSGRVLNENDFPLVKHEYQEEHVSFVNIFGDGLSHRVRVRNGQVECWPFLGYGKFGRKILLENAPFFENGFDRERMFWADIDGSGVSDLVYAYPDRIEVFFNLNGNSFSDPVRINLPCLYDKIDQIGFSDILGNGTACLVFTKIIPEPVHYYYNFVGELVLDDGSITSIMKPYLLNEINNNSGVVTQIQYCSSTKFYLEDKKIGKPWMTKLPFPVQVVEQTTTLDKISGNRFVKRYKYHNGYYDTSEREFRGFGFIESWDTETFDEYQKNNYINDNQADFYIPPVYTRSWYHTGSFIENNIISRYNHIDYFQGDVDACNFPDSVFQQQIMDSDSETIREAYSSLKGHLIRTEIYANDNTMLSANPYTVTESNYEVTLVQPRCDNSYAVFTVNPRETVTYNYDRNPSDPRIQQDFTLEVDNLSGEILKACTLFLPRRSNQNSYKEQSIIKATLTIKDFFNNKENDNFNLRGILCQEQHFEIFNLELPGSKYFTYDELKKQVYLALQELIPYGAPLKDDVLQTQQLSWIKYYFWNDEQDNALPLMQVSSRKLAHHQEKACFTKNSVNEIYGSPLSDRIIEFYGGYFFDNSNGYWWNRGLIQYYFLPSQPEFFYLSSKSENSFVDSASSLFKKSTIEYDYPYCMLPVLYTEYLDEKNATQQKYSIDYCSHLYKQVIDINNNISQVLIDPLGEVIASSLIGKENGVETGGMLLYETDGKPAEYIYREKSSTGGAITIDDILANTEYYLQGAANYFFYSFETTSNNKSTLNTINLIRENYYKISENFTDYSCQVGVEYFDGLGRSVEKKQMTDFIPIVTGEKIYNELLPGEKGWVVSGLKLYDNKGNPCKLYLPFFSKSSDFEVPNDVICKNILSHPTLNYYDPLSRLISVVNSKGFLTKVEFSPWEEIHFDENDALKDSEYYRLNSIESLSLDDQDAIRKAECFYNTPSRKILDNTGKAFLDIRKMSDGRELVSCNKMDINGRVIESVDARLYKTNVEKNTSYYNFRYLYMMDDESPILTDSVDSGVKKNFNNIFNNQLWSLSPRNYCQIISYDRFQRKTELHVKKIINYSLIDNFDDFNLVEIFTYGENIEGACEHNLCGNVFQVNDLSGKVINYDYSMQGMLLSTSRQMAQDYKKALNWNESVALENDIYKICNTYNAINQLITEEAPDQTITTNVYNSCGLLRGVSVSRNNENILELVSNIVYDASYNRLEMVFGNGVNTLYEYEPATLRLLRQYSKRSVSDSKTGNNIVQDIRYTYDPVGNITRMRDLSFDNVYNNNQQIEPLSDYSYDALYRLITASGREHPALNSEICKNKISDKRFRESMLAQLPLANDGEKLVLYNESYVYDDSGNMIYKSHNADKNCFVFDSAVNDESNRLVNINYDDSGNQLQSDIDSCVRLTYNCCENLVRADLIVREDKTNDAEYCLYDSNEVRTRKVCERFGYDNSICNITEKIYFGNFEIKRNKNVDDTGKMVVTLERQTLRVNNDRGCIAIIHHWLKDDLHCEVDAPDSWSTRFQMGNSLGSISLELDVNALLISYEEYYPYGGTALVAGDNVKEVRLKEYRYSGKECDESTGFYYYGARYYMAWSGRWNKPDPAGTVDGSNLYAFVGGNPVKNSDPDGRQIVQQQLQPITKRVDQTTFNLLNNANLAIQYARGLVPFAGNVFADINITEAESTARFGVQRYIFGDIFKNNESANGGSPNAINRAVSAMAVHGGACNEFSALTHTSLISTKTTEPIIRVWDPFANHSFTMIGDPRAKAAKQIVVADAWPSSYQAATLEDTRWNHTIGVNNLIVHTETPLVSDLQAIFNVNLTKKVYTDMLAARPNSCLPDYQDLNQPKLSTAGRFDPRGPKLTNASQFANYFNTTINNGNIVFLNTHSTTFPVTYTYTH